MRESVYIAIAGFVLVTLLYYFIDKHYPEMAINYNDSFKNEGALP